MIVVPLSIEEWAEARRADVLRREFGNSLLVSEDKPLGSRAFTGLWDIIKYVWWARRPERRGTLASIIDKGADGKIWAYVWHIEGLERVIAQHWEVISEAGWPLQLREFVQRSREEKVPPLTPLYDVIADAYGDKLNPGRSDVMRGVPRAVLFDAVRTDDFFDPAYPFVTAPYWNTK